MNFSSAHPPTPLFSRGIPLCLLFIFSIGILQAATLPKVVLFTTGGTIQSKGENRDKLFEYTDGKVTPQELVDDLPELQSIAAIETVEISNIGSGEIGATQLLELVKAINAALARPDVTGAVVTHGTSRSRKLRIFSTSLSSPRSRWS
jgi:L-asparaginase